jgi:hypothetical protein
LYVARRLHRWHAYLDRRSQKKELPAMVQQQISELQKYRSKYGKLAAVALAVAVSLAVGPAAKAAEDVLPPPVITTVSNNISDKDIFYLGGETGAANATVVVYLQSLESSATQSEEVQTDKNGEWFYRHDSFLPAGHYVLWTQTKIGEQLSPPSPQIALGVETTAINFGATRISYVTLYFILAAALAVVALALAAYIAYKFYNGRRKHQLIVKQISEAEASVRRGFAVLNRDIQAELSVIRQAKLSQKLGDEEKKREEQLLKDLDEIEQYLSKEIWDIEEAERTGKA